MKTPTKQVVTLVKNVVAALHVHQSNSSSSKRTRAAAVASFITGESKSSRRRRNKKNKKLNSVLINIQTAAPHYCISRKQIDEEQVFVDGGIPTNREINPSYNGPKEVTILRIKDNDLFVPTIHLGNNKKGLRHRDGEVTSLVLCPREEALYEAKVLYIDGLSTQLANAYAAAINKANKIKRGKGISIECTDSFKYACVGSATIKNGKGSRPLHHVMVKMKQEEQSILIQHVKCVERLFEKYMETTVIRNVREGIKLVNAPLLQNAAGEKASIYQSFAVGKNIYLSCHTDKDFVYSAVTVIHKEVKDEVVAYFNFPRLGLSIPLKPFDVLFFNPKEPHMISSRCHDDDDIYCLSFYLKTGLIGGNDNDLKLTEKELECLRLYEDVFK